MRLPYAASSAASAGLSTGSFALIGGHGPLLGTLLGVDGHDGFVSGFARQNRAVRRTHHDVVGVDRSADDGLPESPRGADHHLVAAPIARVGGEHHPSGIGLHHLLDHDGQTDHGRIDALPAR